MSTPSRVNCSRFTSSNALVSSNYFATSTNENCYAPLLKVARLDPLSDRFTTVTPLDSPFSTQRNLNFRRITSLLESSYSRTPFELPQHSEPLHHYDMEEVDQCPENSVNIWALSFWIIHFFIHFNKLCKNN